MNIKIKATNFEMGNDVHEYITRKMTSLSKFLRSADSALCEIEVGKTTNHHKSGDIFKAEVNITDSGRQFYTVAESFDIFAAIDEVRDEIEREVVSKKKRYLTLFRRGAKRMKDMVRNIYRR